jgi:hypothetical protein
VITKPCERPGRSPLWAAEPEKMIIIIVKYVSTIPGNHEVKELQKTAILETANFGKC